MTRILREPLVHVFALGIVAFGLSVAFEDARPPTAERMIAFNKEDARGLAAEFEVTRRRTPTPDELDRLIEHSVHEQALLREAKALVLDQGDSIARRSLQTKTEFLTKARTQIVAADVATLPAQLVANAQRFAITPVLAVEQVYPDANVDSARSADIASGLSNAHNLLPSTALVGRPRVINGIFGTSFLSKIMKLPPSEWGGLETTSFGQRLAPVTDRSQERLLAMRAQNVVAQPDVAEVPGV
ncbi:MAG: hypothetical protein WBV78_15385 [Roseobacter sp.]